MHVQTIHDLFSLVITDSLFWRATVILVGLALVALVLGAVGAVVDSLYRRYCRWSANRAYHRWEEERQERLRKHLDAVVQNGIRR